jgi:hypothetical protein
MADKTLKNKNHIVIKRYHPAATASVLKRAEMTKIKADLEAVWAESQRIITLKKDGTK